VFVMILYLNAFQPQVLEDWMRSAGLRPPLENASAKTQQEEKSRTVMINALLIPNGNKRDLQQGRPFWGAAQHMIALAMKRQPDGSLIKMHNNTLYEFQNYFFSDQRGLLTFEFQDNSLACVHYLREQRSACNNGRASLYANQFPYAHLMAQYNQ
jgi:hypothetical protein